MTIKDKIFLTGHNGMVGSSILRLLLGLNFQSIFTKSKSELDLTDQFSVKKFFDFTKSSFLTQADKPYNNTRHIQFNEKNEDIFNKIKVKKHMITILRKSLKLIV